MCETVAFVSNRFRTHLTRQLTKQRDESETYLGAHNWSACRCNRRILRPLFQTLEFWKWSLRYRTLSVYFCRWGNKKVYTIRRNSTWSNSFASFEICKSTAVLEFISTCSFNSVSLHRRSEHQKTFGDKNLIKLIEIILELAAAQNVNEIHLRKRFSNEIESNCWSTECLHQA